MKAFVSPAAEGEVPLPSAAMSSSSPLAAGETREKHRWIAPAVCVYLLALSFLKLYWINAEMSFLRNPPTLVVQQNPWWCWAACMEMINRAHPSKFDSPIKNQAQWVAAMQASPVANTALNSQQGLNLRFFGQFTNALKMMFQGWVPPTSHPDLEFAEYKLHSSLLLAIIPSTATDSHFVVIWGFDNQQVFYTDPAPGQGHRIAPYSLVQQNRLLIAWK